MTQVYQDTEKFTTVKVPASIYKRVRLQSVHRERQVQDITAEALSDWLKLHEPATDQSLQETPVAAKG